MLNVVLPALRYQINYIIAFAVFVIASAGAITIAAVLKPWYNFINHFATLKLQHLTPLPVLPVMDSIQRPGILQHHTRL